SFWAGLMTDDDLVAGLLLGRLDAGRLERGAERLVILAEHRFALLLGETARNDAELGQPLGYLRRPGEYGDLLADLRQDRLRRAGRREETVPRREFETWQRLGDGRNVGRRRDALRGADRHQPDRGTVGVRQQLRGIAEIHVDAAGQQIRHRLRAAFGRD